MLDMEESAPAQRCWGWRGAKPRAALLVMEGAKPRATVLVMERG